MAQRAVGLCVILGLAASAAQAQTPLPAPDPRAAFHFTLENDAIGDGKDRWYSNGFRLGWASPEGRLPGPMAALDRALGSVFGPAQSRWNLAVGQQFYTASDIRNPFPSPQDRPYAGYLFAELGLDRRTASTLDRFSLQAGIVGPSSLARSLQVSVHDIIGDPKPRGWGFQLQDEPVANLGWERTWRTPSLALPLGLEADALPAVGLAAGTVRVHAMAGVRARIGQGLENDFGPARLAPATGNAPMPIGDGLGWYLFVGAGGRAIARDIFLDGNTFRDSRSVDREPVVGDFEAGGAVFWRNVRLSYSYVYRTKEFKDQPQAQSFGAIALTVAY